MGEVVSGGIGGSLKGLFRSGGSQSGEIMAFTLNCTWICDVFWSFFPPNYSGMCPLACILFHSKYCPAGCLLPFAEISGTIPHGYRDVSWI